MFCNFDAQSLCEFTQGTGDQFDWTLNSGATSSGPSTGPTNDVSSRGQRLFYESNNSFKGGWITSWAYVLKAKVKNNNLKIFEKRGSPWFPAWGRGGRVLFLLLLTKLFFRICSLLSITAQLLPRSLKMAPLFPTMFFLCSLVPENHYLRKIFCCRKMEFPCLSYVATRDKCFIS